MFRLSAAIVLALLILTSLAAGAEGDSEMANPEITAKLNFIYVSCNDLETMRHFYSELLGMTETSYREGPQGWLVYKCGDLEFMLFPSGYEIPVIEGWGMQPGWEGGTVEGISWSVDVGADSFRDTVRRLIDGGVDCFSDKPMWCQDAYWSFPVRDPMGNTVEVHYYDPALPKPESTEWSWDQP